MRGLIASMNLTIDGCCDHTHVVADKELHQYAQELLASSGALVLGRDLLIFGSPGLVLSLSDLHLIDEYQSNQGGLLRGWSFFATSIKFLPGSKWGYR